MKTWTMAFGGEMCSQHDARTPIPVLPLVWSVSSSRVHSGHILRQSPLRIHLHSETKLYFGRRCNEVSVQILDCFEQYSLRERIIYLLLVYLMLRQSCDSSYKGIWRGDHYTLQTLRRYAKMISRHPNMDIWYGTDSKFLLMLSLSDNFCRLRVSSHIGSQLFKRKQSTDIDPCSASLILQNRIIYWNGDVHVWRFRTADNHHSHSLYERRKRGRQLWLGIAVHRRRL